jgi:hypothetical protein
MLSNERLGLENADCRTVLANLEALKLWVVVREGRFYVSSIAGTWGGEIRKAPRGCNKDGPTNVQFVPDFHTIAIFPNTDQDCRKISRGRE